MKRTHILLVEDDPGHQQLIRRKLQMACHGATVTVASTLESFLSALRTRRSIDCVLLDFNIPGHSAREFLGAVDRLRSECPVIVISDSDDQHVAISSFRHGGFDFVPKKSAMVGDELWRRITAALRQSRKRRRERRVSERRKRKLIAMAETDPLTGLANRRCIDRVFKRNGRTTYDRRGATAAVMVDVDHFKAINDEYGHDRGDHVLRSLAREIVDHLGRSDTACRWGGEEFLVLRDDTSAAETMRWAETLRDAISRRRESCDGREVAFTVSVGVAMCDSSQLDESIIRKADVAMYYAKRGGRNRVCCHEIAEFSDILHATEGDSPADRVYRACWSIRGRLGPVQRKHLTSHAQRVARTAVRIGNQLGMPDTVLADLWQSGMNHDLGKIAVPDSILNKGGPLSANERFLVNRHAADGAELIGRTLASSNVVDSIRYHHRRFDAPPNGIDTGAGIPLGARILNAADAFVTMTTSRTYQPVRGRDGAIDELKRERGGQFCPRVVAAAVAALSM
jgi:diguanylate cyclase (GGDEF)-like protein